MIFEDSAFHSDAHRHIPQRSDLLADRLFTYQADAACVSNDIGYRVISSRIPRGLRRFPAR